MSLEHVAMFNSPQLSNLEHSELFRNVVCISVVIAMCPPLYLHSLSPSGVYIILFNNNFIHICRDQYLQNSNYPTTMQPIHSLLMKTSNHAFICAKISISSLHFKILSYFYISKLQ